MPRPKPTTYTCKKCRRILPASDFDECGKSRVFARCRACRAEIEAKRTAPRWIVDDETGCWNWQLARSSRHGNAIGIGYGVIRANGRNVRAHRYVYEAHKGPIPTGMQLDHLCRNPSCVNPDHMEPVTHAENLRRGNSTKLTMEIAREIRAAPGRHRDLAERYGIDYTIVGDIKRGVLWREDD